jgi:hypothetical protein
MYTAQASLKLKILLQSAEITGMCHHTWQIRGAFVQLSQSGLGGVGGSSGRVLARVQSPVLRGAFG